MMILTRLLQVMNPGVPVFTIVEYVTLYQEVREMNICDSFKSIFCEGFKYIQSVHKRFPLMAQQLELGRNWKDFLLGFPAFIDIKV